MESLENYIHKHFKVARFFFLISATYGLLMRLQRVVSLPKFEYTNFLQAHSHVTFLGWGFLGTISLLTYVFLPKLIANKTLKYSFFTMVVTLVGMLISFPMQGYKVFSIVFLSVYLLASYLYLGVLYRYLKDKKSIPALFIRTGILYYYLSSLAIWAVPVIRLKIGKGELYHNAIGFYTHFLYNGFFVLVLFGLFFKYLQDKGVKQFLDNRQKPFYYLISFAVIPTFFLSLLMNDEVSKYVVVLGFIGVVSQLLSLFYLIKIILSFKESLQSDRLYYYTFLVVMLSYILKILIQFFSAFPIITQRASGLFSFLVIGYIHLFTLGFMSLFLLFIFKLYTRANLSKPGLVIFIAGIITTESLLFTQGGLHFFGWKAYPNFDMLMLIFSSLLPTGLFLLYFFSSREKM